MDFPSQVTVYSQNVKQMTAFMPHVLDSHEALRAQGPEGVRESESALDSMESSARKQLANIATFREKLGIGKRQTNFSTAFANVMMRDCVFFLKETQLQSGWVVGAQSGVIDEPGRLWMGALRLQGSMAPIVITRDAEQEAWVVDNEVQSLPGGMLREASPPQLVLHTGEEEREYWGEVRDELRRILSLSLHELADVLGLSYQNVQGLGKWRPQAKTSRPLLRLHGLVKAYLVADAVHGEQWLRGEGSHILHERGLDAFEAMVEQKVFAPRSESSQVFQYEPEADVDLRYASDPVPSPATGESL